jgi:hypothetical protein
VTNAVGYALNLLVTPNTEWAGNPMDPKGEGRKISHMGSNYPVLADNRS